MSKFTCEKCGKSTAREPKLRKATLAQGGYSVLGRQLDARIEANYIQCPQCGEVFPVSVSLPFDPDAELIHDVFDTKNSSQEEQQALIALLREYHITPADLEELRELKSKPTNDLKTLSDWFTQRGLPAPEFIECE
jgi:hypothetical protein